MIRAALGVATPLCLALSVGGILGIAAVEGFEQLGLELSERLEAFPVIAFVVLFGFRGAVGSASRLAHTMRERDAYGPGARR
jgi:hypothetical protein